MITLDGVLLVGALACFTVTAWDRANPRVNLIGAGLALWMLSVLV